MLLSDTHRGVKIILASQSKARYAMLKNAGVNFKVIRPVVDEMAMVHELMRASGKEKITPEKIALDLAKKKALAVAGKKSRCACHRQRPNFGSGRQDACRKPGARKKRRKSFAIYVARRTG